ncbi:MAG: DDE-type integrase/transposase/recombinase [Chloroflexi bacterium]|nr:DDE-type integrase/transposase/recombinase [Chloroflexota bacterium]
MVPAVSGSSGRLIVSPPKQTLAERTWPGRVFEREDLSYTEAMDGFIAAREAAPGESSTATSPEADPEAKRQAELKAERRALRRDVGRLRTARRAEREQRKAVDEAWRVPREAHRQRVGALSAAEAGKREEQAAKRAAEKAQWRAERSVHHQELMRRRQADDQWREERRQQREREAGVALVTAWIAVLVVLDNCTRQCLGLPLFVVGAHVTAELVVEALKALLPTELQYLISDGGKQFTAAVMQELAKGRGFVRVPLARHRPESNGIAERFVETLKGWLAGRKWQTAEELRALLLEFRPYYNDRPHQGDELAGLSPNEYAARMAVV